MPGPPFENLTAPTPKANPSDSLCYRLDRQPAGKQQASETTHSTKSRILAAYSTGLKPHRAGRADEVTARPPITMIADLEDDQYVATRALRIGEVMFPVLLLKILTAMCPISETDEVHDCLRGDDQGNEERGAVVEVAKVLLVLLARPVHGHERRPRSSMQRWRTTGAQ